jgi:hypothetical protein
MSYPDDLVDILPIERGTILRDWFEDGVRVVVLRANFSMNVYMGVPLGHPLVGHSYDDLPINCHGGLTFAAEGDSELPEGYYWYGYDYCHLGDYMWSPVDSGPLTLGKKWSLGEIVKESWEPVYDFKKLVRLTEAVSNRQSASKTETELPASDQGEDGGTTDGK